jgi:hypothetical protein
MAEDRNTTAPDIVDSQQRLVDIGQELRDLAPDAFAERLALSDEADTLRKLVMQTSPEALAEAKAKWAGRAGLKGAHEIDPEIAKAVAVSKGMGAGHAGGG